MALFNHMDKEGVPVLEVQGKLGMDALPRFQAELDQLCSRPEPTLVLDLMECPYMCSRTFPPLLHVSERLESENRQLLIACGPDLLEILEILRLDQRLNLHTKRASCLAAAHP